MDRILVQPSEIPTDTMFLATNKNTMVALGYLAQAVLGNATVVDGFSCTATSPASLSVLLSTGSVYSFQNIDSTAYGTISADTADQIIKQGILLGNTTLSCPAPSTTGQSINYLIQVAFSEIDTNAQNIQFYNSSNPAMPITTNINTLRQATCILSAKAGASATTGTQVTPAPDAGYTGLYVVTVANGQTTITSGNITQLATAPFISPKLPALAAYQQTGSATYAQDTSGSGASIIASLTPAIASYTTGQPVRIKSANTCAAGAVMNLNGIGNVAIYDTSGNSVHAGQILANSVNSYVYDGAHMVLQSANGDQYSAYGQCQFKYTSSTVCTLFPYKGNKVAFPSGAMAIIPSAGIPTTISSCYLNGVASSSLAANTLYYAYLWYSGSNYVINFSTTGYVIDAATGIAVQGGNSSLVLIGMVYTDASPHFVSSASSAQVRGYFNDGGIVLSNNYTTSRSTTSMTLAEINTEIRCNTLLWQSENISISIAGTASNSATQQGGLTGIGVDSTSAVSGGNSTGTSVAANNAFPVIANYATNTLSEGLHYFTLLGEVVSTNTLTYSAVTTLTVFTRR